MRTAKYMRSTAAISDGSTHATRAVAKVSGASLLSWMCISVIAAAMVNLLLEGPASALEVSSPAFHLKRGTLLGKSNTVVNPLSNLLTRPALGLPESTAYCIGSPSQKGALLKQSSKQGRAQGNSLFKIESLFTSVAVGMQVIFLGWGSLCLIWSSMRLACGFNDGMKRLFMGFASILGGLAASSVTTCLVECCRSVHLFT